MRHLNLWILVLGLVTISCTLPDPLSGHCGNDYLRLGDIECQCVTPDQTESEGSVSYEEPELDYLEHCWKKDTLYSQRLDPGDTDIYVCSSYRCATKTCPDGTVPDKAKRKCIEKVDCPDPKEVYDQEENACQCDDNKHFTGQVGSCVCETGYVYRNGACEIKPTCGAHAIYDEDANTCRCETGFEKSGNECVALSCDGAYEFRDENGTCVCDKGYLRFGPACIKREDCTGVRRADNGEGKCICWSPYAYVNGDCYMVGEKLEFGRYPQTAQSEALSPLIWQILDITEDAALLISEYVLEQYTYHDKIEDITWEWSNVRSYLNGFDGTHNKNGIDHTGKGFIDFAFTPAERKQIRQVTNTNPDAPADWNSTPGGNDTEDKIFLLSRDEAFKYFPNNKSRLANPTAYAIYPPTSSGRDNLVTCEITCSTNDRCVCQGGTVKDDGSSVSACSNIQCSSRQWLRSPGSRPTESAGIYFGGSIGSVENLNFGLRPVLYIYLNR